MKLSELNFESSLSLMAELEGGQTDIPITRAELSEDEYNEIEATVGARFIPLEVIVQEYEKKFAVISFQNSKAKLSLIAFHENELYKWDNVVVDRVQLQSGKSIHLVKVPNPNGSKFNRRRGVRIDIGRYMEIEQKNKNFNVLIKDLSYCGLGIMEKGESKIDVNEPFTLHLTESRGSENRLVAKIVAKVIRQEEIEGGYIKSGCIIAKGHYNFLQRYVATKQMENLQGKSGGYSDVMRADNSDNWKKSIAKQLENYDE